MKKTATFLEKWGHYLLALLCAGVVFFSAVWQGKMERTGEADFPAGADQAQRLEDAKTSSDERRLIFPTDGKILHTFSDGIFFDSSFGLWRIHPAVDFEIRPGEAVRAMAPGTVETGKDCLIIRHENGDYSVYRGLACVETEEGRLVKAGERIGTAGKSIPLEGELLCISYYIRDTAVDFTQLLINQ